MATNARKSDINDATTKPSIDHTFIMMRSNSEKHFPADSSKKPPGIPPKPFISQLSGKIQVRSSDVSEGYYSDRDSAHASGDSATKRYPVAEDAFGYSVTPHEQILTENDAQPSIPRNSSEVKLPLKPESKKKKKKKEKDQKKEKERTKKEGTHSETTEKTLAISSLGIQKKYEDENPYEDIDAIKLPVHRNIRITQGLERERKISCPEFSRDLPEIPPPRTCPTTFRIPKKTDVYANVAFDPNRTILKVSDIPSDSNISLLSVSQVADCLRLLKVPKHVDKFKEEQIDGRLLGVLTFQAFLDLGLNHVEAYKLESFVKGWRPQHDDTVPVPASGQEVPSMPAKAMDMQSTNSS